MKGKWAVWVAALLLFPLGAWAVIAYLVAGDERGPAWLPYVVAGTPGLVSAAFARVRSFAWADCVAIAAASLVAFLLLYVIFGLLYWGFGLLCVLLELLHAGRC